MGCGGINFSYTPPRHSALLATRVHDIVARDVCIRKDYPRPPCAQPFFCQSRVPSMKLDNPQKNHP